MLRRFGVTLVVLALAPSCTAPTLPTGRPTIPRPQTLEFEGTSFRLVSDDTLQRVLIRKILSPDMTHYNVVTTRTGEVFGEDGLYRKLSDLADVPGTYRIFEDRFCVAFVTVPSEECRQLFVDLSGRYVTVKTGVGQSEPPVLVTMKEIAQ